MRKAPSLDMLWLPGMLWTQWAWKMGEMLLASAQVITHRSAMIHAARGRPTPAQAREFTRMGSEKLEAYTLASAHALQGWVKLWLQLAGSSWPSMSARSASIARLSERVLRPVHGKATANARRLAARERASARRRIARL